METVQQNGRFTLFSSKFPSNIILFSLGIAQSSQGGTLEITLTFTVPLTFMFIFF